MITKNKTTTNKITMPNKTTMTSNSRMLIIRLIDIISI